MIGQGSWVNAVEQQLADALRAARVSLGPSREFGRGRERHRTVGTCRSCGPPTSLRTSRMALADRIPKGSLLDCRRGRASEKSDSCNSIAAAVGTGAKLAETAKGSPATERCCSERKMMMRTHSQRYCAAGANTVFFRSIFSGSVSSVAMSAIWLDLNRDLALLEETIKKASYQYCRD